MGINMVRKKKRQKRVIKSTWKELLKNGNRLFFNVLLYSLIAFMLIRPIFNTGVKFAMDMTKCSYITVENIISFLIHPVTIIVIIGLFFVIGCFLYYGLSFVMIYVSYTKKNQKFNVVRCHFNAIKRVFLGFRARNIIVIFFSILIVINSNMILIYGMVTRTRIPKYIVTNLVKLPYSEYFLSVIAVLFIIICYFGIFTIPYCVLERKSFRQAFKSSVELLKGNKIRTIRYLLVWNIGIAVISAAIYFLAIVIAAIGTALFVKKSLAVAMFLSIYQHINFYVGFVVGIIGIVVNVSLSTYVYFVYKQEHQEDYTEPEIVYVPKKIISRKMIYIFVLCCILVDIVYTYDTVKNGTSIVDENFDYIGITSHRGNSSQAPENTIPALESAIEELADYAEIDVQQTKDGVIVLMHDSNLKRTTGYNGYLWNLNYEKVQQLDAGSWYGPEFAGTKVPTLEEVLHVCKGKINLNIELKNSSKKSGLEERVVELIEKYNFQRQCIITSTHVNDLNKIKTLNPQLKTGYIIAVAYGNFYDREDIDFFSMRSSFLNEAVVQKIHSKGKEVHAWTVNNRRELERMKRLEVDNVITDKPVFAREIVYQEENTKSFIELLNVVLKWKE